MLVHGQEPTVCTLSSHTTSLVKEDSLERRCVAHSLLHTRVDVQVLHSDCATTRVSVVVAPAVRAGVETCSLVPVVVVELRQLNGQVFRAWGHDASWRGFQQLSVITGPSVADQDTCIDLRVAIGYVDLLHLDARSDVIIEREVIEVDVTDFVGHGLLAHLLAKSRH